MIVISDQYVLLTGEMAPVSSNNEVAKFTWTPHGPFANQTEVVRWMMLGTYKFDQFKIVKIKLPLLEMPDKDTIELYELAEDAEVVELEDEKPYTTEAKN